MTDEPSGPEEWTVRAWRATRPRGRGRAAVPPDEIELVGPDGQVLSARSRRRDRRKVRGVTPVRVATPRAFPKCPTCLDREADTAEHVPPASLGGAVMCTTCARCNNSFGSWVEAALTEWYDNAASTRLFIADEAAPITSGRFTTLWTDDGQPLLLTTAAPGTKPTFRARPHLTMTQRWYSDEEVSLALLKSAYLAGCVLLGAVPVVPSAVAIRQELMAVVEAGRRSKVRAGPHASGLRFGRVTQGSQTAPVVLMQDKAQPGAEGLRICLAGRVIVDWPFPEIELSEDPPTEL